MSRPSGTAPSGGGGGGGGGGGTVAEITSADGSAIITSPVGPVTDISTLLNIQPTNRTWRDTPLNTTAAPGAPAVYTSLGTPGSPITLQAGKYLGITGWFIGVSAANTAFWVDLFVFGGGSAIGAAVEQLGLAGAQTSRAAIVEITVPGPGPLNVWFDLVVAKNSGSGSVTMYNGFFGIAPLP